MGKKKESRTPVGIYGIVRVKYLGGINAKWIGPVTKTKYRFGPQRRFGYLDVRDAKEMISAEDNGIPKRFIKA